MGSGLAYCIIGHRATAADGRGGVRVGLLHYAVRGSALTSIRRHGRCINRGVCRCGATPVPPRSSASNRRGLSSLRERRAERLWARSSRVRRLALLGPPRDRGGREGTPCAGRGRD